jgi:hypothetical protein
MDNGQDEYRTHGQHSAVDDEPPVRQEPISPPPADAPTMMGMEAIPAEMPNSEHADISLEYSLQNFNALVAANTAMQTEISAFGEKEAAWRELVDSKDASLKDLRDSLALHQKHSVEARELHIKRQAALDDLQTQFGFVTAQRDVLQRRLDRSLGYLDRVIDQEDEFAAPPTETMPRAKPPVGPAIGEIPDPVKPGRDRGGDPWMHGEPMKISRFEGYAPARMRRY